MIDGEGRKLSVLLSPGFLLSLCLLLLNDFAFKPQFNNWLTGKLSDFAGLFIFPLFWSALLPRFRRAIYFLTAASFAFWKSAHVQPLIDAWNGLAVFPVGRTVDASDLLALFVLPLSFFYYERRGHEAAYRLAPYLVACASLLAFTATSFRTEHPYDNKYRFGESAVELTRRVYHLSHVDSKYQPAFCSNREITTNHITVEIPSDFCFDDVEATIGIAEEQGQSIITLKKMEHRCPEGRNDSQKLLGVFEKQFIERLKQVSLAPVTHRADAQPSPTSMPRLRAGGQIYFVAVGEVRDIDVEGLTRHFGKKYGVPVTVLPLLPLTNEMRLPDFPNSRPVAERIIEFISDKYPKVIKSHNDLIIGITDDMNAQSGNKVYNHSYDLWGHFALVATEGLRPSTYCEPENKELLESRLRKVIARNVGALYFDLPKSSDPRSVLYSNIGCVDELDYQGEAF